MPSQNKKIKHERCLTTHYALEILESKGNKNPSQTEIAAIEKNLETFFTNEASQKNLDYLSFSTVFPKRKALLIENHALCSYAHSIILENLGFCVELFLDPSFAIKKEFHQYDLVIASAHLPSQNIHTIVRHINAFSRPHKPFIIVLSNEVSIQTFKKYLNEGADRVLKKPLCFWELSETLHVNGLIKLNS